MHGNVSEWCADIMDREYYAQSPVDDPTGPEKGAGRVIRGASTHSGLPYSRSAFRNVGGENDKHGFIGFRVAMSIDSPKLADTAISKQAPAPAVAPFDEAQARVHQQAWADYLDEPVVTANSVGMKLAVIPTGEFQVKGKNGTVNIKLTQPQRFAIHEVSQGQWNSVMKTEPWKGVFQDEANAAAVLMNWYECAEFCRKLTERERAAGKLPDQREYRLPTTAE